MNKPVPIIDERALQEKLRILTEAARHDVSCASSGSPRSGASGGVCHSWAADGRCVSLLKILMTNHCRFDCAYCANRCSNTAIERAELTVEELVALTLNLHRRNCIEGLFLSSGIRRSADETMLRMVAVARSLREDHGFRGYIHLKVIPGASPELIRQAGFVADRLSVNLELPSEASLNRLAPQKSKESILAPMACIRETRNELLGQGSATPVLELEDPLPTALPAPADLPAVQSTTLPARRNNRKSPLWTPAGQSTQMIIGASPESDYDILRLSESLYRKFELKRVYFSAYVPMNEDSRLPALTSAPPLCREHRLYQADWLLRFYQFNASEILSPEHPFLEEKVDPKAGWALRNLHLFPIDVMTAPLEMLLRVPGIGPRSASRIVRARRHAKLREEELKRLGVVLKRARFFITGSGVATLACKREIDRQDVLAGLLGDNISQQRLLAIANGPVFWQPTLFE
jgi:putative DNA modification/repair radical SAM protein